MPYKKRRTFRRRRKGGLVKTIKRIAKQVVMKSFETQNYVGLFEPVWYNNGGDRSASQWFPITYPVGQGNGEASFAGNSLVIKAIDVRLFLYTSTVVSGSVDQDATFRVSLIATNEELTLAGIPAAAKNYGYIYNSNVNGTYNHFNPQYTTVVKDRVITIKGGEGTTPNKVVHMKKTFKKGLKIDFKESSDPENAYKYCKGKNYYLVFSFYKPSTSLSLGVTGGIQANMKVTFKDC